MLLIIIFSYCSADYEYIVYHCNIFTVDKSIKAESMAFFDFIKGKGLKGHGGAAPAPATTITSINIRLGGDVHSLPGKDVSGIFDINIPFKNRLGNGLLPDNLKGPDITVSTISIEKPFELISIKPALPINVQYMSEENFALRIKPPDGSYNGPLFVKFGTGSSDNIDINVAKIVLVNGEKRADLESSAFNMNIKKGQVFRRDIQLYKILSFQQKISSVEASAPFSIVSTQPSVPLSVDVKDSYIVTLFIKCPEFNYAGDMEIVFR